MDFDIQLTDDDEKYIAALQVEYQKKNYQNLVVAQAKQNQVDKTLLNNVLGQVPYGQTPGLQVTPNPNQQMNFAQLFAQQLSKQTLGGNMNQQAINFL